MKLVYPQLRESGAHSFLHYEGIARNAYGLAGAGSVLVEMKGGIGQKQSGMIIKHALYC